MNRRLIGLCCLCLASLSQCAVIRRQTTSNTSSVTAPIPEDLALPSYVIEHAPIVWLNEQEAYWPAQLEVHLNNTRPMHNTTAGIVPYSGVTEPLTLANANGSKVNSVFDYWTSIDVIDVQEPTFPWLLANYGKPDGSGKSASPIIIVLVNKTGVDTYDPPGDLDAFYFFFYSYNLGPNALGERFGNHVGDLEHAMIRFNQGVPQALYVSTHDTGEAYFWNATQINGTRPVIYSANGTHATYATPGLHDYSGVPFINDYSDAGVLWDVALNYNAFWYSPDSPSDLFVPATGTDQPTGYLYTVAKWGDQQYPSNHPGQSVVLGFAVFTDGPTGPIDHTLIRNNMGFEANQTTQSTLPAIINGSTTPVRAPAPHLSPGLPWWTWTYASLLTGLGLVMVHL